MRLRALLGGLVVVVVVPLVGCGGSAETSATPGSTEIAGSRLSRQARKAGCRTICTKCAPGTPCLRRCTIECPDDVVPCGDTACRNGEVCCNESCGICTPPDGVCTMQECAPTRPCVQNALCIRGFHWSPRKCACVPDTASIRCTSDDDCRLFSDYCTGCDCRALTTAQPDPTCTGPGVRCFADPCMNKAATCNSGLCVVTAIDNPPTATPRQPRRPRPPRAPHPPRRPHQPGTPH